MPRISQKAKEDNRRRILDAASEMFREQGVDQVGIDQLMQHAGLTRGGFYNHFESKEALVAEACRSTFTGALAQLNAFLVPPACDGGSAQVPEAPGATKPRNAREALESIAAQYLCPSHRDAPSAGCPTATLGVDIGRHSVLAQRPYAEGIRGYLSVLAELLEGCDRPPDGVSEGEPDAGARATELLTGMVGAMVLARAVREADPALSEEILSTGRRTAAALIGSPDPGVVCDG